MPQTSNFSMGAYHTGHSHPCNTTIRFALCIDPQPYHHPQLCPNSPGCKAACQFQDHPTESAVFAACPPTQLGVGYANPNQMVATCECTRAVSMVTEVCPGK